MTVIICNLTLDKIYIRLRKQNDGQGWPEFRLPYVIAGGLCLPPVIAFYGWIPALRLPLSFEFLAMSLLGFVLMFAFLPLMTYVVDAFGIHSASAITALIVTRCLMGTFLPLATEPLVEHFGYGWGFTIIGGLLLALAPIPVLLYKCGQSWRQHSVYSRDS